MEKSGSSVSDIARKMWREGFNPWPLSWNSPFELSPFQDLLPDESHWLPKADYSETDKEVCIKVDLPNVDPKKVSVEVDNHALHLSGETETEDHEEGETWYRAERSWVSFKRSFSLPTNSTIDGIHAEAKNGTIFIRIPKTQAKNKRKVLVERG